MRFFLRVFAVAFLLLTGMGALVAPATVEAQQRELLSRTKFAREMVRVLRAALPNATVRMKNVREIEIRFPDSERTFTLFLDNAYAAYEREPHRLEDVLRQYASTVVGPAGEPPRSATAKVDRTRIVPVVKDRKWLDDMVKTTKAQGMEKPPEPLFEPYNDELVVIYAEDQPKRMRYLMAHEADVPRGELRALAVKNLLKIMPKIQMAMFGEHVAMMSAGGDYDASLLLVNSIWQGDQVKVKGEIVVAIPTRDTLLITGSQDKEGLEFVREQAKELAAKPPHNLIDTLFVYREGRFVRFDK